MFSILLPTFNNLEYLKVCVESIQKNSKYEHQIIVHINEGIDGTLEYVKNKKLDYSLSSENIGMPRALNKASKLSKKDYILISHDDFYYCPGWDIEFVNEINIMKHNNFYLSGTMVGATNKIIYYDNALPSEFNAGNDIENFNESRLLNNLDKIKTFDFQGTTKCPGLIHKKIWIKVGGWSEEFSPTGGDDSDFAMKLWQHDIRIFKGLGKSLVYHFGSVTTRKKKNNLFTYLGNKGNKIFLKKWKITINFFENFYLKSGLDKNKNIIFNKYDGELKVPQRKIRYCYELLKCKIQWLYLILINYK